MDVDPAVCFVGDESDDVFLVVLLISDDMTNRFVLLDVVSTVATAYFQEELVEGITLEVAVELGAVYLFGHPPLQRCDIFPVTVVAKVDKYEVVLAA